MTAAPPLELAGAGKRYGACWALRETTLSVPEGSVTALLGPNGAGKTTLLHLAVGLSRPDEGVVRVFGRPAGDGDVLPHVGFVAQEHPLFRGFTLAETLAAGRRLNDDWDEPFARERIAHLGLPLAKKIAKLSGGQQSQVALTLALAKRPRLLVLDEPVASLDPLARREFLQTVLEAVTERGTTVLLSSHIVSDLENVCDHVIVLSDSRVRLTGPIDTIVAEHRVLTGPATDADAVGRMHDVIRATHTARQTTLLVHANGHVYDARWQIHDVGLEEIALAYFQEAAAS